MVSLYLLNKEFEEAFQTYTDAETDVEKQDALRVLSLIQVDKEQKYANCCAHLKNLDAMLENIELATARLKDKKEALSRKIEKFRSYIASCVGENEKWTDGVHSISWRASESVEILDEKLVPEQYTTEKVTYSPDKRTILRDLKAGASIPGCEIKRLRNLQIK